MDLRCQICQEKPQYPVKLPCCSRVHCRVCAWRGLVDSAKYCWYESCHGNSKVSYNLPEVTNNNDNEATTNVVQTNEKFKCNICNKVNKCLSSYKGHILSHFNQEFRAVLPNSPPNKCPECKVSHKNWHYLVRHYAFTENKFFIVTRKEPGDFPLLVPKYKKRQTRIESNTTQNLFSNEEPVIIPCKVRVLEKMEDLLKRQDIYRSKQKPMQPDLKSPESCVPSSVISQEYEIPDLSEAANSASLTNSSDFQERDIVSQESSSDHVREDDEIPVSSLSPPTMISDSNEPDDQEKELISSVKTVIVERPAEDLREDDSSQISESLLIPPTVISEQDEPRNSSLPNEIDDQEETPCETELPGLQVKNTAFPAIHEESSVENKESNLGRLVPIKNEALIENPVDKPFDVSQVSNPTEASNLKSEKSNQEKRIVFSEYFEDDASPAVKKKEEIITKDIMDENASPAVKKKEEIITVDIMDENASPAAKKKEEIITVDIMDENDSPAVRENEDMICLETNEGVLNGSKSDEVIIPQFDMCRCDRSLDVCTKCQFFQFTVVAATDQFLLAKIPREQTAKIVKFVSNPYLETIFPDSRIPHPQLSEVFNNNLVLFGVDSSKTTNLEKGRLNISLCQAWYGIKALDVKKVDFLCKEIIIEDDGSFLITCSAELDSRLLLLEVIELNFNLKPISRLTFCDPSGVFRLHCKKEINSLEYLPDKGDVLGVVTTDVDESSRIQLKNSVLEQMEKINEPPRNFLPKLQKVGPKKRKNALKFAIASSIRARSNVAEVFQKDSDSDEETAASNQQNVTQSKISENPKTQKPINSHQKSSEVKAKKKSLVGKDAKSPGRILNERKTSAYMNKMNVPGNVSPNMNNLEPSPRLSPTKNKLKAQGTQSQTTNKVKVPETPSSVVNKLRAPGTPTTSPTNKHNLSGLPIPTLITLAPGTHNNLNKLPRPGPDMIDCKKCILDSLSDMSQALSKCSECPIYQMKVKDPNGILFHDLPKHVQVYIDKNTEKKAGYRIITKVFTNKDGVLVVPERLDPSYHSRVIPKPYDSGIITVEILNTSPEPITLKENQIIGKGCQLMFVKN